MDLSISRDGGATFGNSVGQYLRAIGLRKNKLMFWRLGVANDAVVQLRFWSWDVLLFDCFTAQLDTKQMKAEEFGAVMGLAIGGEQTGKLDMLYALAEQGLVGTKPEVRPIP